MTEQRIVETRDPAGNTHTHTTVVHEEGQGSGGVIKWLVLLLIVVAAVVGIYLVSQSSASEVSRDNAIAEAAGQVGDAAEQAGDAVEDVADSVTSEE